MAIVKWNPNTAAELRIKKAMQLVRYVPRTAANLNIPALRWLDMPRRCAADRGSEYAARYMLVNGGYRYATSVRVSELQARSLYRQRVEVSWGTQEERCAICGAVGRPIFCTSCEFWVCRGMTLEAEEFFRCWCGNSGYLTDVFRKKDGFYR